MEKDGILTAGGYPIQDSGDQRCAECRCPLTPENISNWASFVTGNLTTYICKDCEDEMYEGIGKKSGEKED